MRLIKSNSQFAVFWGLLQLETNLLEIVTKIVTASLFAVLNLTGRTVPVADYKSCILLFSCKTLVEHQLGIGVVIFFFLQEALIQSSVEAKIHKKVSGRRRGGDNTLANA